jgi:ATP-binding cassette, subfamily B, bacterial MsbA
MKQLFSVLKYTKGYKKYVVLNIVFNILFAIFSALTLALVAPFIQLIFKSDLLALNTLVNEGLPSFSMSGDYFNKAFNFLFAKLIVLKGKEGALILICCAVVVVTFLKNLSRYLAMYFIAPIRNGVVRDLRNKMYKKAMELPLSYYSDEKKGDIMSRMTTDVQEIEWSIMQTLEMIFREPLTIIILFGLMLAISLKLTLYILLLLPIAALCVVLIGKSLKGASRRTKETLGQLISLMEETLGSLKIIKGFHAQAHMRNKFEEVNQRFYKQSVRVYRQVDLGSPLNETIVMIILMLILYLGGLMVFESSGTFAALFITYFGLASQLIPPIKQITQSYNNIQKGLASEERINRILDAEIHILEAQQPKNLSSLQNQVEFKNVSFTYKKEGSGYVLKDINLVIEKGKRLALVGQSGSGKTTLADMLLRFYDADKGEVLLDGINIKDIRMSDLRQRVGVVTQESILFNDTVLNNIAFGLEGVTESKIIEAAKIANAHEFISKLPEGYNSIIGDRGGKLSGGQRQRLSIARAVLRNPDILILDEATSALDTESERLVQDALNNLMEHRTGLIIAHRLSTIMHADEIIVLQQGEIAERGTHQELLQKNGIYKKLCDMQSFG